jgi:hypothetical protein
MWVAWLTWGAHEYLAIESMPTEGRHFNAWNSQVQRGRALQCRGLRAPGAMAPVLGLHRSAILSKEAKRLC